MQSKVGSLGTRYYGAYYVKVLARHHRTQIHSFGVNVLPFACVPLGCGCLLELALYLGCGDNYKSEIKRESHTMVVWLWSLFSSYLHKNRHIHQHHCRKLLEEPLLSGEAITVTLLAPDTANLDYFQGLALSGIICLPCLGFSKLLLFTVITRLEEEGSEPKFTTL